MSDSTPTYLQSSQPSQPDWMPSTESCTDSTAGSTALSIESARSLRSFAGKPGTSEPSSSKPSTTGPPVEPVEPRQGPALLVPVSPPPDRPTPRVTRGQVILAGLVLADSLCRAADMLCPSTLPLTH